VLDWISIRIVITAKVLCSERVAVSIYCMIVGDFQVVSNAVNFEVRAPRLVSADILEGKSLLDFNAVGSIHTGVCMTLDG